MVEVPSHTLEHYSTDPRVLALFARHHTTGEPLPAGLLERVQASRRRFVGLDQQQQVGRGSALGRAGGRGGLAASRSVSACGAAGELRSSSAAPAGAWPAVPPLTCTASHVYCLVPQLQYCLIDQLLHGPEPPTGAAAEAAIAGIMGQHSALGHAPGAHPHIR